MVGAMWKIALISWQSGNMITHVRLPLIPRKNEIIEIKNFGTFRVEEVTYQVDNELIDYDVILTVFERG